MKPDRHSPRYWPANYASPVESEGVPRFLSILCDGLDATTDATAPGREGSTRGEAIFRTVMRIYAGRCAPWLLEECAPRGYLSRASDYHTLAGALAAPTTTEILTHLIEASAEPLAEIENRSGQFAIGSTFGYLSDDPTLHIMICTTTKVVTSAKPSPNVTVLPDLLAATAKRFAVKEVIADAGYFCYTNLEAIDTVGAVPFIPFKRNYVLSASKSFVAQRMLVHWHFMPEEVQRRVERSRFIVHRTLAGIMGGGSLRSRVPVARANELLALVLIYNLRCLCRSTEELGM